MIFIPKQNVKIVKLTQYTENIIWNYNENIIIKIQHYPIDQHNSFVQSVNDCSFNRFFVLPCADLSCSANPQLRYNNIIKKYFCCCPSSMICTKNNDKEEIKFFKNCGITEFNQQNGFADNALNAICLWQINNANLYIKKAKEMMQ